MTHNRLLVRSLVLTVMVLLLTAGSALAAVTNVIARDSQRNDILFDFEDIVQSFTRRVLGLDAILFDRFAEKRVVAVSSARSGYVCFEGAIEAYTRAIIEGRSFNLVQYIESPGAKLFTIDPNTQVVSLADGRLRFTAYKGAPPSPAAVAAALRAVNEANSVTAMKRALTDNAAVFGLDLTVYNGFHLFARGRVGTRMLQRRSFADAGAVQVAFHEEVHAANSTIVVEHERFDITLARMVEVQMRGNPETDLLRTGWRAADRELVQWHVNPDNFQGRSLPAAIVSAAASVNVRQGPGLTFPNIGTLTNPLRISPGAGPFFILSEGEDDQGFTWYRLLANTWAGWVRSDMLTLTTRRGDGLFQFLLLSGSANASAREINDRILNGRGNLAGTAQFFIDAARAENVNEIFLISLALHETGNGTSTLATGVDFTTPDGNTVRVFNMFGIGAIDFLNGRRLTPEETLWHGANHAFNNGWTTPELAIRGGARFISTQYVNHPTRNQNTLYKMRWNPANPGRNQYATDVGWAIKQIRRIETIYDQLETFTLRFAIPRYNQ